MGQVHLRNCNNIEEADINFTEGETTVLFGMNGTGKSSIAKAIMLKAKGDTALLGKMSPFGLDVAPVIDGVPNESAPLVFNDDYVEETLFRGDLELISNGYRIFIESPRYKEAVANTAKLFNEAKKRLSDEGDVEELLGTVTNLLDCYGRSNSSFASSSSIGRGIAKKGDLVANIPPKFEVFRPLITDEHGSKWIKWHISGSEFDDRGVCPYCGNLFDDEARTRCADLQEVYGGKYLDHCHTVFEAFGRANKCLSDDVRVQIEEVLHGRLSNGSTPEDVALLNKIKADAGALKERLEQLKTIGFSNLRTIEDKIAYITSLRIPIDRIDMMNSTYVREKVESINGVLDDLLAKATDLQIAIGQQSSLLKSSIRASKKDIDDFLEAAGFPYEIGLVSEDGSSCAVSLKPRGIDLDVTEPKARLSYGERNALAIALFSAQVKSENPPMIILDDPISSFDQSKKYAIIQRLFGKKAGVCRNITTILLTHDPETLIMLQNVHRDRVCPMAFFFVHNTNGMLNAIAIEDADLGPTVENLREIAKGTQSLPLRIASARRVIELTAGKTIAWSVLSSLLHVSPFATLGKGDNAIPLSNNDWTVARKELQEVGFADFDYDSMIEELSISKLISTYSAVDSPVEKICIFRVVADIDPSATKRAQDRAGVSDVVFEFADKFFHIENLMVYQLNPAKYDTIPASIIDACNKVMAEYAAGIANS